MSLGFGELDQGSTQFQGFEAIIRSETPDNVWKSIEMYQKSCRKDLERNNSHKMPEIAILLKWNKFGSNPVRISSERDFWGEPWFEISIFEELVHPIFLKTFLVRFNGYKSSHLTQFLPAITVKLTLVAWKRYKFESFLER